MMPLPWAAAPVLAPQAADQQLMQRVLAEQAVVQVAPAPSWSEYLLHVLRTMLEAVLGPLLRNLPGAGLARWMLVALAAVAGVVLIALIVRALRGRRRRTPARAVETAAERERAVARALGPADWRARLDAHLGSGDVASALDALWWWLAVSVAREPVDPSWTTRELLARAGRTDLGGFSVALDRLAYAAARPAAADVRAFAERLQAAL
jgi:hypothetical protein